MPVSRAKLFLKEKIWAKTLISNDAEYRETLTVYERLSLYQVHIIRIMVHEEFAKFAKKPKGTVKVDPETRYPTISNLHSKIQGCQELPRWSVSTTREVLLSMGFR